MDFDLRFWGPYPPLLQWAAYWITDICRTRVLTNYVLLNILTNSQMSALSLFRSISTYYRFMCHGMFQQNALKFATILEYYTFSCFEFLPNQILLPFSKNHQLFRLSTSSLHPLINNDANFGDIWQKKVISFWSFYFSIIWLL